MIGNGNYIVTISNTSGQSFGGYLPNASGFVSNCTCNMAWNSVLPPPPCPMHSGAANLQPWYGSQPVSPAPINPAAGCVPFLPDWPYWEPDEPDLTDEEIIQGLQEIIEDLT